MNELKFKAGNIELSTWTNGYPMWMTFSCYGEEVMRLHHNELKDLAFVIERMLTQAKAIMPDSYKHEFD